ncbi:unnamed protein product, partial [Owenia fusiformis]
FKMVDTGMSYREIVPNQSSNLRWKDITFNSGNSLSTLQDIKLPECAGGYTYRDSGKVAAPSRNRFIYWRTFNDCLELVEQSLDFNLTGNAVRFKFQDTPILNGVGIHESHGYVVILVSTVCSVHRLMFPHPNKLQKMELSYYPGSVQTSESSPSIFMDASINTVRDPANLYSVCHSGTQSYQIHTATSWLTGEGEALFGMATNTGSILLIKLPSYGIQGIVLQHELRQSSMMKRLWSGLVPAAIRGGQEATDASLSLAIHPFGQDIFIFSVCRDHKIRMWSCKNQECVMASDLLEHMPDSVDPQKTAIGAQGHILHVASGSTSSSVHLGVFLSFSDRNLFIILQPVLSDGQYKINSVVSIFGHNDDLIDFCVTSNYIWTLWMNSESDTISRYVPIDRESTSIDSWNPVFLQPQEVEEIEVPDHKDPRETYLQHIFSPGRFSTQAIVKALQIYRRSHENISILDHATLSIDLLKQEVSAAVETEIQRSTTEFEMAPEDYYQLQHQQWAKFYSCCTQYFQVEVKPLGIFADNVTGMVAIIRKNVVSFLRPCDTVEHLVLTPIDYIISDDLADIKELKQDDQTSLQDVISVCDCVKMIGDCVTSDWTFAFENDIFYHESPEKIVKQIVDSLLVDLSATSREGDQMLRNIKLKLHNITGLIRTLDTLLDMTDLAKGQPEELRVDDYDAQGRQLSSNHLFTSDIGLDILSQCIQQMSQTRFNFLRDLLILQVLMTRWGEQIGLNLQMSERIKTDLLPKTSLLVHGYHVLCWCCAATATPIPTNALELSERQLAALEISETSASSPVYKTGHKVMSLAELFMRGVGGPQCRLLLSQNNFLEEDPCAFWSSTLQPTATIAGQLLWPISVNFLFPEFLMLQCQYSQLQEYFWIVHHWCEWNPSSRKFLLGQSYLNSNEPEKALDCFLEAVHGVGNEEFLLQKLLMCDDESIPKLEILYYLKVIKLLEEFNLPDLVISLATTAIRIAEPGDPNIPTLWSKSFKHHLELCHNEEAYSAMIANIDPSRRKDCLRQFIVVLCERSQLRALVEFPYIDMYDDVVNIIESRARSVDLATHNYYDLLYSFHVYRSNFRKAGSVMYEYGMRLGRELPGLKGLQRQAKCYLACLNALRLVDPKYAWIVKPVPRAKSLSPEEPIHGVSPKRNIDGEIRETMLTQRIELLELQDIEKEYMLVHSRLSFHQKDPEPSYMTGPTLSAPETIGLLVNAGLFDNAVTLSKAYGLSLATIFEGLASRCIRLSQNSSSYMQGDNDYTADAWSWLNDNELTQTLNSKEISSADQAWRLLHLYLDKYATEGSTYHKCVALRLLSQGFSLPNWFIAAYKKVNPAELLRLYLDHDWLDHAAHLAIEYIDAVLGKGGEYFGLKTSLNVTSPSVWLPYTCLDQLLNALGEVRNDAMFIQLYEDLKTRVALYQNNLSLVTEDKLNTAKRDSTRVAQSFYEHEHESMVYS